MLPSDPRARAGQRASPAQSVRSCRGAREAGRGRGVPDARRQPRTARALHTAPSRGRASETRRCRQPHPSHRAARTIRHHRGASEMELYPAAAARPARNGPVVAILVRIT